MSDSVGEGVMINRLIVLLQFFAVPVYFVFYSTKWKENLASFFDGMFHALPLLKNIVPDWFIKFEINLGIPIFFSLPWVVLTLIRATRIADAYYLMGKASLRLRIDAKIFYGLNAAFTLIFFIFPIFSPLITIVAIFWMMRAVMRKLIIGRFLKFTWWLPALILAIPPGLITIAFFSNYSELLQQVWGRWLDLIPYIYGLGLTLAIAITYGNFVHFLFEGAVKYGDMKTVPTGATLVLKALVFGLLALIYYGVQTQGEPQTVVNICSYFAAFLGTTEMIMRRVRDLPAAEGGSSGMLMVVLFSVINMIITAMKYLVKNPVFIQTILIFLAGVIFILLFYAAYSYAPEYYEYKDEESSGKKKKRKSKQDENENEDSEDDTSEDEID